MFKKDYMLGLPKNRTLAAYQICNDLFEVVSKTAFLDRDIPRIAKLSDDDIKDALLILEELLGDELPYEKIPRQNTAAATPGREAGIARIQIIHRHLKVKIFVLHVDENDAVEHHLLVHFQQDDIRRVNDLLSEIRELVRGNSELSEDHKLRLLKIASEFQAELDKPKSRFHVFLDGLVEASEALGQAGKKAKPAFDRFREILGIAEKRIRKTPQLEGPAEQKRLPPPIDEGDAPSQAGQ